jgi:hypothetical protein
VAFVDGKGKGKATVGRTNDTTYTRLTIWVTQQRAVCFFFFLLTGFVWRSNGNWMSC